MQKFFRKWRSILNTALQQKFRWTGHVLRHESLLCDITEGRTLGKATRGRKRLEILSDITSNTYENLKREAGDRSGWFKRLSQTATQRADKEDLCTKWSYCLLLTPFIHTPQEHPSFSRTLSVLIHLKTMFIFPGSFYARFHFTVFSCRLNAQVTRAQTTSLILWC